MQGEGAWFCLNLMFHALLRPHGKPYSLRGVDREWAGGKMGGGQEESCENCGWNVNKILKKIIKNNLSQKNNQQVK